MFSLRQEATAQKVHEMFLNSIEMSQSAHKEKGSFLLENVHLRSECVLVCRGGKDLLMSLFLRKVIRIDDSFHDT